MKFTKFIPVALALALTCPAFATPADEASQLLTINVDPFINITVSSTLDETDATITADDYTAMTVGALNATFHVVTNVPTDKVYLTAWAKENSVQTKALGGAADASALKIAFTNDDVAAGSPTGAIENALGLSPSLATNKETIAFNLTPTITKGADMDAAPTGAFASNVVTYTFTKAGNCDFQYVMATSPITNTFDTHDTAGTYKSTLSMTHAAP